MEELAEQVERALEEVEGIIRGSLEGSTVLEDMGTRLIDSGGKRLRPELLLVSYIAGGGEDLSKVHRMAAAFELIHTASLIHDDITDDPTLRRRRPAPHRRYGLSRALVAGDFIFAKAFELLAGAEVQVSKVVADAAVSMAEGEHLELILSFDANLSRDRYDQIMEKKTASLFVAAAKAGAMMGGMDDGRMGSLEGYAQHLGMAFQIVDDVLDLEPSAALTGKPSGMDLREGRMNTVLFKALEKLEGTDRDAVVRVFMASSPSTADVENALALVRGTGAGGIALKEAQRRAEMAVEALDEAFEGEVRGLLENLAMEVVRRRS